MTLASSTDLSAADWIVSSARPWHRLVGFGPEGYEAYARLRFLPDPAYEGQTENNAVPQRSLTEHDQLHLAVVQLGQRTTTPQLLHLAWWDGWGAGPDGHSVASLRRSRFHVPNRSYFLFHSSLAAFADWHARTRNTGEPAPAFIWPADHAWCLANDVDPHWAGVGASRASIADLRANPYLDVAPADPEAEQPHYP